MIRWSPTSRVFSIDPDGITRACPSVPLTSKNTRTTQAHAIISLFTRAAKDDSTLLPAFLFPDLLGSAFTLHRNRFNGFVCGGSLTNFQLHEIRGIDAGIAGRAEIPLRVADGLLQPLHRKVPERIRTKILADFRR